MKSKDDLLQEAVEGWRKYGQYLDHCSFHESRRYVQPDGKVEPGGSGPEYRSGLESQCRATFDDGDEVVWAANADYAFWLFRPTDKPELEIRDVLPIDELTPSHRIARSLIRRLSHPDYLYRDKLLEVVKKPYFELISFQSDPTESYPNLFRVEFNYEHEYIRGSGGTFNWPQQGRMWLDADNYWAMVRCQVKNRLVCETKETSYTEQLFEFAPVREYSNQPRHQIRRTEFYDLDSHWNRKGAEQYITEYALIP
ncbi:MAG: hypothetical protein AAF497_19200, partial [Planctomycetota bacterium]